MTRLLAILLALPVAAGGADAGAQPVKIDATERRLFEGWGTSLCWWAHQVGDWPDDRLDELLELIASSENGLGCTIFRYNVGGGDAPDHDHMRPGGDIPGFKGGPDQPYDWDADAKQRRVLLKLRDRVPDPIFEAFSNSPPYWMTDSGCASGAEDGGSNLRPDAEAAFADYLTEVVRYYRDKHGLVFRTLSPMNEPDANWWRAGHNQEGCHVSTPQQQRVIQEVAKALREKQLSATGVAAPESNNLDDCLRDVRAYDEATLAALTQINTHTYAGTRRKELHEFSSRQDKRLWQSESGPLDMRGKSPLETYLAMAERIVEDLNELKPAAWLDWQVVDGNIWGCFRVNHRDRTFRKSEKYPFYAIFTRHIRPGDSLLRVDQPHLLAAISERRRVLTMIAVNSSDKPTEYRVGLKDVRLLADRARIVRTSALEDLVEPPAVTLEGSEVTISCPPQSVTALLVQAEFRHDPAEGRDAPAGG